MMVGRRSRRRKVPAKCSFLPLGEDLRSLYEQTINSLCRFPQRGRGAGGWVGGRGGSETDCLWSYSAALKRAAGQNELQKKGRGRKEEDGGGDAELDRKTAFFLGGGDFKGQEVGLGLGF